MTSGSGTVDAARCPSRTGRRARRPTKSRRGRWPATSLPSHAERASRSSQRRSYARAAAFAAHFSEDELLDAGEAVGRDGVTDGAYIQMVFDATKQAYDDVERAMEERACSSVGAFAVLERRRTTEALVQRLWRCRSRTIALLTENRREAERVRKELNRLGGGPKYLRVVGSHGAGRRYRLQNPAAERYEERRRQLDYAHRVGTDALKVLTARIERVLQSAIRRGSLRTQLSGRKAPLFRLDTTRWHNAWPKAESFQIDTIQVELSASLITEGGLIPTEGGLIPVE